MLQRISVVPGVSLQVAVSGSGPALVFIHGMGGNLSFWAAQAREFSPHFRVIRYDLRGHGDSSSSLDQDIIAHVQDLATVLTALGVQKTHLVGLSMGGLIAQLFAALHPQKINRLALISTVSTFPVKGKEALRNLAALAEAEGMAAVAAQFVPQLLSHNADRNDTRIQVLMSTMSEQDAVSFAAAARALAETDVTPFLEKISATTLLCYGEHDRQTPSFLGERIAAKLANARMKIFLNAGHMPSFDSAQEFYSALFQFLTSEKPNF